MPTLLKRGFGAEPPSVRPELHLTTYKSADDPNVWASTCRGPMEIISFRRSANINRSRAIMRYLDRKLNALGFSEDAVDRLSTGLAEAIPNALIYGIPGSRVGVVIVITGQAPHRNLLLLVSNFITPAATLPAADQVPDLEEILFETHGRGTGILKILANDIGVARSENFDLLTVVHFTENLP